MKKSILFIVMAAHCLFFNAKAQQQHTITGKTTDQKGIPIPGSTIKIKGEKITTLTNTKGDFTLTTSQTSGILIVSFIGYQTREIPFSSSGIIPTIELEEEKSNLNEVVVIGYGQTTKRMSTGSIASISAKEIESQPVTNVLSALSGRMPGVFVQTTNGLPGGNINVQIRGKGSLLAGTSPLYIVDGVPYDSTPPNAANSAMSMNNIVGTINPLNNLNPNDIENITVLKDADATSIYGSRGANGVVLITTKKASAGSTKVEGNLTSGFSKAAARTDLLNLDEYLLMRREAFSNDNLTPSSDPLSPNYAPDLTVWDQTKSTDWHDYLFGNKAGFTDVQVKVSGGKHKTTFSVSGNYHQESTLLPGYNKYQRGGLYSQFQHRSEDDRFKISVSNQLSHQYHDISNPVSGIGSNFLLPPNYPLYLLDGSFNWVSGNIASFINSRSKAKTENTITSLNVQFKPHPHLNIQLNGGYTKTTYDQTLIYPTRALRPGTANYTDFGKNSTQSLLLEPQIDYSVKFGNSSFSFLAGATYQSRTNNNQFIQASNYRLESLMEDLASAGAIDSRISTYIPYKYASIFGRVTYNLSDRFIINSTFRRDGSSRFGPGNRFGNFGSVGAAWIFSDLRVLKENLPFLNFGKLRLSYGTTGNDQIQDYQYTSTYNSPGTSLYQDLAIVRPSRLNNANFHWETTRKADFAVELGFLENRIFLTADYYINRSTDQLVNYTLPQITGFSSYQANLPAEIENKGLEVTVEVKILNQKKLTWNTTFNLTLPENKLISFQDLQSSSYAATYELGYDITRIKGYKYLGVNPSTGAAQYAGQSGEVSIAPYQNFTLGKSTPDYFGGFGNSFKYGNFTLDIFAQFVKQKGVGSLLYVPGNFTFNNFQVVNDRWTPSNTNGNFPKATTVYDFNFTGSSANIFDTSYLRLKNISLSYTLSDKLLKAFGLDGLRVYGEAQNLFTIWNREVPVLDPESGGNSSATNRNFPSLKSVVFGLQFTL